MEALLFFLGFGIRFRLLEPFAGGEIENSG